MAILRARRRHLSGGAICPAMGVSRHNRDQPQRLAALVCANFFFHHILGTKVIVRMEDQIEKRFIADIHCLSHLVRFLRDP